jgi:glycerol uptake facilitator-like aquaporin
MGANVVGKFLAEFIGTGAIVLFGTGSVYIAQINGGMNLLGIALTFGGIVALMVASTGHVSGAHINPAVTVMCVATKRMKADLAAVYIVAQLAGAVAAAFALKALFGPEVERVMGPQKWAEFNLGTTGLAPGVSTGASWGGSSGPPARTSMRTAGGSPDLRRRSRLDPAPPTT